MKKATEREIKQRYESGERDFQKLDLRNEKFKELDLSEASFLGCDLRGTIFDDCTLKNCDFSEVLAGQNNPERRVVSGLSIFSALISGFITSQAITSLIQQVYQSSIQSIPLFPALTVFGMAITYIAIKTSQNTGSFQSIPSAIRRLFLLITEGIGVLIGLIALVLLLTGLDFMKVALYSVAAGSVTVGLSVVTQLLTVPVHIILGRPYSDITFLAIIAGGILNSLTYNHSFYVNHVNFIILIEAAVLLDAWWAIKQVIEDDPGVELTRSVSIYIASIGGTLFKNSDLENTKFNSAKLGGSIFSGDCNLTRISWLGVDKIQYIRSVHPHLKNPLVRKLLTDRKIQGRKIKNFDDLNLEGINLSQANLIQASFQRTNLSGANLCGANLSEANLICANLNKADLSQANLSGANLRQVQLDETNLQLSEVTGACIDSFGITATTAIKDIKCHYIYMRDNRSEGRFSYSCRKPDSERINWQPGEFSLFIQPYIDTIDLYHSLDFDPISNQLALLDICEKYEDSYELVIKAIEIKGSATHPFINIKISGSDYAMQNAEITEYYYGRISYYRELKGSDKITRLAEKTQLNRYPKASSQIASITNIYVTQISNRPGDNVAGNKYLNNS